MIPIKIKAKLNAYTKVNPLDNQFVDAPTDDNLYGRKNGIWVQIDENSNQVFRSEIEDMLDKQILEPDGETIVINKNNKLAAVALYDDQYDNLLADDVKSQVLGNPITATELRSVLADLLSRLTQLKAKVDAADTEHKNHEVIWNNFDEINKIIGELTDLKLTINQLDGKQIDFDPKSLVDAIKTLESVVYSNFDIINGNVGDISDLQEALRNHNINIKDLSQAVKELTEVVYDNFDKINEAIGDISELQQVVDKPAAAPKDILDVLAEHNQRLLNEHDEVNKLTAEVSDFKLAQEKLNGTFVTLSSDQNIDGVKTFTNGFAVNGTTSDNKQLIVDLRPGTDIKIEQNSPGKKLGIAFDSAHESISIYNIVGSSNENRIDIDSDGAKYNGEEIATINNDSESIKVDNFDNSTLGSYISTILPHINKETGGELISIGFKVALNSTVSANGFKVSNQAATAETTEENGIGVFKGGEYYYLYPTKIVDNDYYFDCSIGELNSKATVKLTNNNEAYVSGQYFNIDSSVVSQVFFTDVDVTALPLEHLTIVYHI